MLEILLVVVSCTGTFIIVNAHFQAQIRKINAMAAALARGELSVKDRFVAGKQTSALVKVLLQLRTHLVKAAEFAESIGEGREVKSFSPASEQDRLGKSLLTMHERLRHASELDEKHNWVNQGLARFVEILREYNNDLDALSTQVVSELVRYTGAEQGCIFVLHEKEGEKPCLELAGGYACSQQQIAQKRIEPGQGLAGQAFVERQLIRVDNLPANYSQITSGLGQGLPGHLLLVPLQLNEQIEGVLELASFHPFEDHKIEFLTKIAENIASTLSMLRASHHTSALLKQSRNQAARMQQQEQILLANQKKLEASQKEMQKHQQELQQVAEQASQQRAGLETLVNNTEDCIISITPDFEIVLFNNAFNDYFSGEGQPVEVGRNLLNYFATEQQEELKADVAKVLKGQSLKCERKFSLLRGFGIFEVNYSPVKNMGGGIQEVSIFFRNITDYIRKNEKIRRSQEEILQHSKQLEHTREAVNRSGVTTAEFDMDGYLLDANEAFLNTMGYSSLDEIVGEHHSMFVPEKVQVSKEYEKLWEKLRQGQPDRGQYEQIRKNGESVWVSGSYNIVKETNGRPIMVVSVAVDVTENITLLQKTVQQARELKKTETQINQKLQEIQNQQQVHQAILHGCVDGVISFDQEGYITFANRAAEEMLGKTADKLLGRNIKKLLPLKIELKEEGYTLQVNSLGETKTIGVRTEATVSNCNNEEMDLLLTVSHARLSDGFTFTIFMQKISVELF